MGFFKRIAGLLGFAKDDIHDSKVDTDDETDGHPRTTPLRGLPRQRFGVAAQVVVDRPQLGPVIAPSTSGDGGVQGLRWYAKRLGIDEDGDVADEFIDVVSTETSTLAVDNHKTIARFNFNYGTPVKVKRQVLTDGKLQQCVELQGRLQWV